MLQEGGEWARVQRTERKTSKTTEQEVKGGKRFLEGGGEEGPRIHLDMARTEKKKIA